MTLTKRVERALKILFYGDDDERYYEEYFFDSKVREFKVQNFHKRLDEEINEKLSGSITPPLTTQKDTKTHTPFIKAHQEAQNKEKDDERVHTEDGKFA